MRRKKTGRYEVTSLQGERVRAFVPADLPPRGPLRMDGSLQLVLERALLALGRLDGLSTLLPDTSILLYTYIRKEAVVSSQIEGIQSSLSDLMIFEAEGTRLLTDLFTIFGVTQEPAFDFDLSAPTTDVRSK